MRNLLFRRLMAFMFVFNLAFIGNAQVFQEDFESGLGGFENSANSTDAWTTEGTIIHGGNQSIHLSYTSYAVDTLFQTVSIDLSTTDFPRLTFWHIAKTEGTYDECYVKISLDDGLTYVDLPDSSYLGDGVYSSLFDEDSYSAWGTSDNPATNSWWKQESFDLGAYKTSSTVKIMFYLESDVSDERDGWYLDDIEVKDYNFPIMTIAPLSKDFGEQQIATSETETISVSNAGQGTLQVNSIALANGTVGFSLVDANTYAASLTNDTLTLDVVFTPTTINTYNDTLIVISVTDTIKILLAGEGVDRIISTFPFNEPFDSLGRWINADANAKDWEIASTTGYDAGADVDHTTGSGTFALLDDSYPHTSSDLVLTSMPFDLTGLTNPTLSFWYWIGDYSQESEFIVQINDGNSWADAYPVIVPSAQEWALVTIDLTPYSSAFTSIRFSATESSSSYSDIAIDDVKVYDNDAVPTCVTILSPLNDSVGVDISGTFTWSSTTGATEYLLSFGTDANGTSMVNNVSIGNVLSRDYTGLNYSTQYFWKIVANNAVGEAVGCQVYNFTTMDDPTINTFPHYESLENSVPPTNWTIDITGSDTENNWTSVTSGSYPTCSPINGASMAMYNSFSISDGNEARLVTPPVDFNSLTNPIISFWMYHSTDGGASYPNELVTIQVSTNNGVAWDSLTSYKRVATTSEWVEHIVDLSAYASQTVKIGFLAISDYGYNMFIDSISVRNASSEANFLSYSFPQMSGTETIDATNHTVNLSVAYGTSVDSLIADFTVSNFATAYIVDSLQVTGVNANDFTTPVVYNVVAEDSTVVAWTVTVDVVQTQSSENDFLTFEIADQEGTEVIDANNHTVDVVINYFADITSQIVTFTSSQLSTVYIVDSLQISGVTAQDFTDTLTYTIVAEDSSLQDWKVIVTREDITVRNFPYEMDFEDAMPPFHWDHEVVTGDDVDNEWSIVSSGLNPSCSPQSGLSMAMYNCYSINEGNEARMITPPMDFNTINDLQLSFWMYHDNGYSSYSEELVNVQVSADSGATWETIEAYQRVSATNGWVKHILDLSAYNNSVITISFLGHSAWGNNIFIDNMVVFENVPSILVEANDSIINNGDVIPQLEDNTNFGTTAANHGAITKEFIINNVSMGTSDIIIDTVTISGTNASEFTVTIIPVDTLTVGNTTVLEITFAPTDFGDRTATVSIANNDMLNNPYTFSIKGIGADASAASDIIENSLFTYTQNIDYILYDASDIVMDSTSLDIAQFIVRDGGITDDTDTLSTILNELTFDINGYSNIKSIALYKDSLELGEVSADSIITFVNIADTIIDGIADTLTVKVSFNDIVTDNAQIQVTISNAVNDNAGSFFAVANAGGASSDVSTDNNRIEVIASDLVFTEQPDAEVFVNSFINGYPVVEAQDANTNIDVDFDGASFTVALTNDSSLTMLGDTVVPVQGIATFNGLKFTQIGGATQLTADGDTLVSATLSNAVTVIAPGIPYEVSEVTCNNIDTAGAVLIASEGIFPDGADDAVYSIAWPFDFVIYDTDYTVSDNVSLSTNGYVRFDDVMSTSNRTATIPTSSSLYGQFLSYGGNSDGEVSGDILSIVSGTTPDRVWTLTFNYHTYYAVGDYSSSDIAISFYETTNNIILSHFNVIDADNSADYLGMNEGDGATANNIGEFPTADVCHLFTQGTEGTPLPPYDPTWADGTTSIENISDTLTWSFGAQSYTYDLWFGEEGNMVEIFTDSTITSNTGTYVYPVLDNNTVYEWQVIVHNTETNLSIDGPVWNFTTDINDATVTQVYTMGKLPVGYGVPHTVIALIENVGELDFTDLDVTLNMTGANAIVDVQTISSLAVGATDTVEFVINPTIIGDNTITVTCDTDFNPANDEMERMMETTPNRYSFSQGDANDGGVGFNSNSGDFVGKFVTSTIASLNQVDVNFTSSGNNFNIGVWSVNPSTGMPDTLIFETDTMVSSQGVYTVLINPVITIPAGEFFVGVRQVEASNIGFAYQVESPIRSNTFFFASPSGDSSWTDFAPANEFRFMIEPKFAMGNDVAAINASSDNAVLNQPLDINFEVINYGTITQDSIPVYYSVNGTAAVGPVYITDTLDINESATGIFDNTFAFTPGYVGTYTVKVYTALTGEEILVNDTTEFTFECLSYDLTISDPLAGNIDACNLTNAEEVNVTVKNVGDLTVASGETIPVSYKVNADAIVTENLVLTADLNVNDIVNYTFTQTADLSAIATHTFMTSVNYANDANNVNDTIQGTVTNTEFVFEFDTDTMVVTSYPTDVVAQAGYDNYTWSTGDNNSIISVNADGWYSVIVDNGNCESTDSIYVILSTDIVSVNSDFNFNVYPNPSNDVFNVNINNIDATDMLVEIIDVDGKVIYNYYNSSVTNYNNSIDVSKYAKGVYYLRINTNSKVFVEKLIVQ